MYVVCVTFNIKNEYIDQFMPLMLNNANTSFEREPECQQFDVCVDENIKSIVFLYEIYNDKAAFQDHLASPHFKEFDAAVGDMISDKKVQIFTRI
ncbi:MAG: putative quinol monooxygenase [Lentilitoribacter sp.]